MTHRERAAKIVGRYFYTIGTISVEDAIKCAILEVDAIITTLNAFGYVNTVYDDFEDGITTDTNNKPPEKYWEAVKEELQKL